MLIILLIFHTTLVARPDLQHQAVLEKIGRVSRKLSVQNRASSNTATGTFIYFKASKTYFFLLTHE